MKKPVIGITMGDPAGIGPELVVRALAEKLPDAAVPLVIGSRGPLMDAMRACGVNMPLTAIADADSLEDKHDGIQFIDIPLYHDFHNAALLKENGAITLDYISAALKLLKQGKIAGIATAPSNKEAMHKAGLRHAGVTELLAAEAGVKEYSTVQIQAGFYVFQMTTHVPLKKAIEEITEKNIYDFAKNVDSTLKKLKNNNAKIGISGLNPHAGDGGVLGDEERLVFDPAIKKLRAEGINISCPQPTDTLFLQGLRGTYDALIYLFHDTANAATKTAAREFPPVVVTAGLPYTRTTVSHGTAYDIAYRGEADWKQFYEAVKTAINLCAQTMEEKK